MPALRSTLAALICAAVLGFAATPSQAASCPAANAVKSAATTFIGAARSGSASAFSSALARHADVGGLAIFALGKYRADLPASRRAEYVKNAQRYMGQFLARHAGRFQGSGLTVEGCKGNLVETAFEGGRDITWRVAGGRIQDVRVSGIWLALQLRSKFTDIIRRGDNRIERLLDFLARTAVAAN